MGGGARCGQDARANRYGFAQHHCSSWWGQDKAARHMRPPHTENKGASATSLAILLRGVMRARARPSHAAARDKTLRANMLDPRASLRDGETMPESAAIEEQTPPADERRIV